MKMDVVASSGNDEFYTPKIAVDAIIRNIDRSKIKKIWCPFDTEKSHFVRSFLSSGFDVVYTHKDNGIDFFDAVVDCDAIISNPPYSKKTEVIDRLFRIGKPFAMLVGVVGLFESKRRFNMFKSNNFEIMYFNKRISYFKSYDDEIPSINPPFSSVYVCSGILDKQICFEVI